jgi:hypothetical protein
MWVRDAMSAPAVTITERPAVGSALGTIGGDRA